MKYYEAGFDINGTVIHGDEAMTLWTFICRFHGLGFFNKDVFGYKTKTPKERWKNIWSLNNNIDWNPKPRGITGKKEALAPIIYLMMWAFQEITRDHFVPLIASMVEAGADWQAAKNRFAKAPIRTTTFLREIEKEIQRTDPYWTVDPSYGPENIHEENRLEMLRVMKLERTEGWSDLFCGLVGKWHQIPSGHHHSGGGRKNSFLECLIEHTPNLDLLKQFALEGYDLDHLYEPCKCSPPSGYYYKASIPEDVLFWTVYQRKIIPNPSLLSLKNVISCFDFLMTVHPKQKIRDLVWICVQSFEHRKGDRIFAPTDAEFWFFEKGTSFLPHHFCFFFELYLLFSAFPVFHLLASFTFHVLLRSTSK
jgi:hypothetical protein